MTSYSQNSDKTLVSLVPTTYNNSGYVRRWDISVEYSFPAVGFSTVSAAHTAIIETSVDVGYHNLEPTGFAYTTIVGLTSARLDNIFDYVYEVAHNIHDDAQTTHVGFGASQLLA